jgi:hypothetical protein
MEAWGRPNRNVGLFTPEGDAGGAPPQSVKRAFAKIREPVRASMPSRSADVFLVRGLHFTSVGNWFEALPAERENMSHFFSGYLRCVGHRRFSLVLPRYDVASATPTLEAED